MKAHEKIKTRQSLLGHTIFPSIAFLCTFRTHADDAEIWEDTHICNMCNRASGDREKVGYSGEFLHNIKSTSEGISQ